MLEIYGIKIGSHIESNKLENIINYLSEKTIQQVNNFKFRNDAQRMVAAHMLVKYVIPRKTNIGFEQILIDKDLYGKPY